MRFPTIEDACDYLESKYPTHVWTIELRGVVHWIHCDGDPVAALGINGQLCQD